MKFLYVYFCHALRYHELYNLQQSSTSQTGVLHLGRPHIALSLTGQQPSECLRADYWTPVTSLIRRMNLSDTCCSCALRICAPFDCKLFSQSLPFNCRLVDFVMGLKRLRILSIDSGRDRGESGRPGDLRTLQKHPSLQEIRLISDFAKAGSGTLPESLCSFFAIQHLKVLSLLFRDQVEVNTQPFLAVLLSLSYCLQKGGTLSIVLLANL